MPAPTVLSRPLLLCEADTCLARKGGPDEHIISLTPTHLLLAVADYRRLVSPGQKSFAELYGALLQPAFSDVDALASVDICHVFGRLLYCC